MTDFERLKFLRKRLGLKQREMSELFEVSQAQYSSLERGLSSITYNHLVLLYQKKRVDPLWIIAGAGDPLIPESEMSNNLVDWEARKKRIDQCIDDCIDERISKADISEENLEANEPLHDYMTVTWDIKRMSFLSDFTKVYITPESQIVKFLVYNDKMAPKMKKGNIAIGHQVPVEEFRPNEIAALVGEADFYWLGRVTYNKAGYYILNYEDQQYAPDLIEQEKVLEVYQLLYLFTG